MTNCNNCCDPLDYVPPFTPLEKCDDAGDGPIAPTPPPPDCPPGYILSCQCVEDPSITPCPDDYIRNPDTGLCEYIYPWPDPGGGGGETVVIYPIPDTVIPYEIKYTVKALLTRVTGSGCRGWEGGAGRIFYEREHEITVLSYGSTAYEVSKSDYRTSRMFCRGPNGETFGRTQIRGPGPDDYNPYPRNPLFKIYGKTDNGGQTKLADSQYWPGEIHWWPQYGDRTLSNYGCNTSSADPPNCWRAYFWTPRVTAIDVFYVKIEVTGGDNNVEDGRWDKEWTLELNENSSLLMA